MFKAKPPSLIHLYKNNNNLSSFTKRTNKTEEKKKEEDFSQYINLDEPLIDLQIEEIEKLNEKQKILLNKIEKMSLEMEGLNSEREVFIKKIDNLSAFINNEFKKKSCLPEEQKEQKKDEDLPTGNDDKYETFKYER